MFNLTNFEEPSQHEVELAKSLGLTYADLLVLHNPIDEAEVLAAQFEFDRINHHLL